MFSNNQFFKESAVLDPDGAMCFAYKRAFGITLSTAKGILEHAIKTNDYELVHFLLMAGTQVSDNTAHFDPAHNKFAEKYPDLIIKGRTEVSHPFNIKACRTVSHLMCEAAKGEDDAYAVLMKSGSCITGNDCPDTPAGDITKEHSKQYPVAKATTAIENVKAIPKFADWYKGGVANIEAKAEQFEVAMNKLKAQSETLKTGQQQTSSFKINSSLQTPNFGEKLKAVPESSKPSASSDAVEEKFDSDDDEDEEAQVPETNEEKGFRLQRMAFVVARKREIRDAMADLARRKAAGEKKLRPIAEPLQKEYEELKFEVTDEAEGQVLMDEAAFAEDIKKATEKKSMLARAMTVITGSAKKEEA
jgi:hypothetical protein